MDDCCVVKNAPRAFPQMGRRIFRVGRRFERAGPTVKLGGVLSPLDYSNCSRRGMGLVANEGGVSIVACGCVVFVAIRVGGVWRRRGGIDQT